MILILSGSRNREGKTAQAIEAMRRGIQASGGEAEILFLPEYRLERCRQCHLDGQGPCVQEGRCVIPDDFEAIAQRVRESDVLVIANPVYFGELTESLRAFLDRFRRTVFVPPGLAPKAVSLAVKGKPAVGFCYAGFRGGFASNCAVSLERALQTCGFDVVDLILARRQNLEVKIPMLELTGRWLVTKPTS